MKNGETGIKRKENINRNIQKTDYEAMRKKEEKKDEENISKENGKRWRGRVI